MLIKEINELRREIKTLKLGAPRNSPKNVRPSAQEPPSPTATASAAADAAADQLRREIDMQRCETSSVLTHPLSCRATCQEGDQLRRKFDTQKCDSLMIPTHLAPRSKCSGANLSPSHPQLCVNSLASCVLCNTLEGRSTAPEITGNVPGCVRTLPCAARQAAPAWRHF